MVLTAVNYRGIAKTAGLTRVLVVVTLFALAAVVTAGLGGGAAGRANLTGPATAGWYGIAQAAALLFFAFAGYARRCCYPGRTAARSWSTSTPQTAPRWGARRSRSRHNLVPLAHSDRIRPVA